jgi:hypothetical protein
MLLLATAKLPEGSNWLYELLCGRPQQLFCGVRRYGAVACRASYEEERNRCRGHIIPWESFRSANVPYRLIVNASLIRFFPVSRYTAKCFIDR